MTIAFQKPVQDTNTRKPAILSHKENHVVATAPTMAQDRPDLAAAGELCRDVRHALDSLMSHVTTGAHDLRRGLKWSGNLERFEQNSMEMARILAKFPVCTTDARFGILVHRARASFIAFRETARREIIGAIDGATDDATFDLALKKAACCSCQADEDLEAIEQSIAQHSTQFPAAPPDALRGDLYGG